MSYENRIILVSDEPDTTTAVAHALQQNGRFSAEIHCPGLLELPDRLEACSEAAVLVDLCADPVGKLQQLEPIARRFPGAVFICLSATPLESAVLLKAMQSGVRHVLLKGDIAAELQTSLRRFMPEGGAVTRSSSAGGATRRDASPTVSNRDLRRFSDRGGADGVHPADFSPQQPNHCVVVFSAAGGAGGTTIAINLAFESFVESGRKTLVVDLDDQYGAVGTYLGLEGQFSVADLLANGDRLDAELVATTALPYGDGLDAIISPASATGRPQPVTSALSSIGGIPSTAGRVQSNGLSAMGAPRGAAAHLRPRRDSMEEPSRIVSTLNMLPEACRRAYGFSVIDAPARSRWVSTRESPPVEGRAAAGQLALARAADAVVVVFQLNVKDIRTARRMMEHLKAGGVDEGRIVAVANRWCRSGLLSGNRDRYSMISPEEASTALGGVEVFRLSNDYRSAIQSINFGQPLSQSAPRSALRKDLRELALRLMPSSSAAQPHRGEPEKSRAAPR